MLIIFVDTFCWLHWLINLLKYVFIIFQFKFCHSNVSYNLLTKNSSFRNQKTFWHQTPKITDTKNHTLVQRTRGFAQVFPVNTSFARYLLNKCFAVPNTHCQQTKRHRVKNNLPFPTIWKQFYNFSFSPPFWMHYTLYSFKVKEKVASK